MGEKRAKKHTQRHNDIFIRIRELESQGYDFTRAVGKAELEEQIKAWPNDWGNDLHIQIYGDFIKPPQEIIKVKELGITVYPDKVENPLIKGPLCFVKATVKVDERSSKGLLDAARRINAFLGIWTLVEWGHGYTSWWCLLDSGARAFAGTMLNLDHKDLINAITSMTRLSVKIRTRLDAALYWIRSGNSLMMEFYRNTLLNRYVSYWNAFECLVDAICEIKPKEKMSKSTKEKAVVEYFEKLDHTVTSEDVEQCYQQIVNPGFVIKASHALEVCFGDNSFHYIDQCFRMKPKKDRLYDIRNAINHGLVDALDPDELLRIESRMNKLFLIVWGIFGRLVSFHYPVDPDLKNIKRD